MKIIFAAGYSSTEQAEDVKGHARELTSRKVLRFLDAASFAPLAAAATVYRRSPVCPPDRVALYTVSGWDADMPDQPFVPNGSPDEDTKLSAHILEEANPLNWLRMLSNNALCQVSIAEGFRGPNAHLVGDAHALGQAMAVAASDLRRAAAALALVVAFDPAEQHRNHPSARAPTKATALALTGAEDGDDVLPRLLEVADTAAAQRMTALAALDLCLADVLQTSSAR